MPIEINLFIPTDDGDKAREMKSAADLLVPINNMLRATGMNGQRLIIAMLAATWACGFDGAERQHRALRDLCEAAQKMGDAIIDADANGDGPPLH